MADLLTLELNPPQRESYKPAELISVTGHQELTLNARRAITILWHHAHRQGVEEGRRYTIEIDNLKTVGHKGYDAIEEAITLLMRTILMVKLPNGKTRRVQFLGGNDLDSPDRPAGVLTYSFDAMLIEILKRSTIWGKIAIPILMAFSSKYSVSLYENVAQMANLDYKTMQTYSLAEMRSMLGVQDGKYHLFGQLNLQVIKPAVAEINALAPFNITILPVKEGKKVVAVTVGWWQKTEEELRAAYDESRRSKVGRKARVMDQVQYVHPCMPSKERLMRSPKT